MLATATVKLKQMMSPRLGSALRETRDRLLPDRLLLRQLLAAESRAPVQPAVNDAGRLHAAITTSKRDILAAQRLRYRVFTEEYGAIFEGIAGIDRDRYDRHARHVVVKDAVTGQVVAYTRLLDAARARRAGGWYSAGEFELGMVETLPGRVLELGRTCVHPDYRNGAAIGVLWGKLAEILLSEGHDFLFGCASVVLGEPGAAAVLAEAGRRAVDDPARRVTPRLPLPAQPQDGIAAGKLPPLLRTYLAMGAQVCGEPCWDPEFNCADLFILVDVKNIPARYVRHFMERRATPAAA